MSPQERKVSFQDEQKVIEIRCRSDFTAAEILFMYYSKVELEEIRQRENRLCAELSMCNRQSSDDDYSTGIEKFKTTAMRNKHTETGIQTVLTEQEQEQELNEGGIREDDYIARVYKNVTRKNKVMARHRGFDNAIQVKSGRHDDPIMCPLSRSSIITDHSPRRRHRNIGCNVETAIESPLQTSSRLQTHWSGVIEIKIDCE